MLDEKSITEKPWIRLMAKKMQAKFDKYWSECNPFISIVVVLDSMNNMTLIDFTFRVIYFEDDAPKYIRIVRDNLYEFYKKYVDAYAAANVGKFVKNNAQKIGNTTSTIFATSGIERGKLF